jgi:hypothetical protein
VALPEWSVQVYRLRAHDLLFGPPVPQAPDPTDPFAPPPPSPERDKIAKAFEMTDPAELDLALPTQTAPEAEQTDFIKQSTAIVIKAFKNQGINPPEGSLFAYDSKSSTLAARTSSKFHWLLRDHQTLRDQSMRNYMTFRLNILAANAGIIRSAVQAAGPLNDHTAILTDLENKADHGQAQRVRSVKIDTSSGRRVHLSSGDELAEVTDFTLDNKHRPCFNTSLVKTGVDLELDPVASEDLETIDLTCAAAFDFAPPEKEWVRVPVATSPLIKVPVYEHRKFSVNTSIRMKSGGSQLLGVWSPEAAGLEPQTMQIVFLTGSIILVQPGENKQMAQLLENHGDRIAPRPVQNPAKVEPPIPAGFMERRFPIPWGSMSPNSIKISKEFLESLGVTFPPEATVEMLPATNQFKVRSTPANLRHIDAFLNDGCRLESKNLVTTLHIIQADAAWLEKLERATATLSDHTIAWQEVEAAAAQGRVQFVNTIQLPTSSGHRVRTVAGRDHWTAKLKQPNLPANQNPVPKQEAAEQKSEKDGQTAPVIPPDPVPKGGSMLEGSLQSEVAGTSFELDPVLSEDGVTVDLTFALDFDFAPPTDSAEQQRTGRNAVLLETSHPTFHRVHLNQFLAIQSSQWRMIGMWQPDGKGKDVMQAAFLRVDVVKLNPEQQ